MLLKGEYLLQKQVMILIMSVKNIMQYTEKATEDMAQDNFANDHSQSDKSLRLQTINLINDPTSDSV